MNVLYFIAVQMKIAFKQKPIDEKIDAATDIPYKSESYHLRFLFFIINSLLFQI
jgi:hypothetical protein